jgi:hypothetical protein
VDLSFGGKNVVSSAHASNFRFPFIKVPFMDVSCLIFSRSGFMASI